MDRALTVAVVLLSGLLWTGCAASGQRRSSAETPASPVTVVEVQPADVPIFADFAAQTYARNMVEVRARVEGYLDQWLFQPGAEVQAGQALYVDQNFALRQPNTEKYLSFQMTPEDRAKWFEHNAYWALYTTDEFVWCYGERMNWWKNETPPGLESAITSARQKIAEGKPLGFDIDPLIEAAKQKQKQ